MIAQSIVDLLNAWMRAEQEAADANVADAAVALAGARAARREYEAAFARLVSESSDDMPASWAVDADARAWVI